MRRRSNDSSSLEMLLDTITNTFGGVLFVAILVVLLLQLRRVAGEPVPPAPQSTPALETRLHDLELELSELEHAISLQEQLLTDFAEPDARPLLDQIFELQRTLALVEKRNTESKKNLAAIQQEQAGHEADAVKHKETLSELSVRLAELQRQLEQQVENTARTVTLPQLRRTSLRPLHLDLRYGRLYFNFNPPHRPSLTTLNLDDYVVIEHGSYTTITQLPYRGHPVDDAPTFKQHLREILAYATPREFYVSICVWDDSFEAFQLVKETLISQGFKYRIVPVTDDDTIHFGSDADSLVQ